MKQEKPARPAELAENLCLSSDLKRLRGMQRELLRSTGKNSEKLNADFAALLTHSQAAVVDRRAKLPENRGRTRMALTRIFHKSRRISFNPLI